MHGQQNIKISSFVEQHKRFDATLHFIRCILVYLSVCCLRVNVSLSYVFE